MRSNTFKILSAILFLLAVPAIFYSLNTGFVMVDDLNDWGFGQLELNRWFVSNFLSFDLTRFRPTWELNQFVAWKAFGPRPFLHHALRLAFKAGILLFIFKMLEDIFKDDKGAFRLSFFVFTAFYIFFPNTPESRLAPQETILTLCFSILCFIVFRVVTKYNGDIFRNKALYIIAIVAYFFLIGSKEVAIVYSFAIWVYLFAINRFSFDAFLKLFPFTALMVFEILQVYFVTSHAGNYGKPSMTWDLILANYRNIKSFVFLTTTSALIASVFLAGLIFMIYRIIKVFLERRVRLASRDFLNVLREILIGEPLCFFALCFIGLFMLSLTFWVPALRYFYPLMFVLVCLFSIVVGKIFLLLPPRIKGYGEPVVVFVSLFFIGVNYYNFLLQYAAQYHNSKVEHKVIATIDRFLREGKKIAVSGVDEHDIHMTAYFNYFSPYYFGTASPNLEFNKFPSENDSTTYYVTRETVNSIWHDVAASYTQNNMDSVLKRAHVISCLFQQTNYPTAWVDGGADYSSKWFIFRNARSRSNEVFLEGGSLVVPGGNPYGEQVVEIKTKILPHQDWGIELTYQTEGNAAPMAIVYGTPYLSERMALHNHIPPTNGATISVRLALNKNINVLDNPLLLFRNASREGRLNIVSYKILKNENNGAR